MQTPHPHFAARSGTSGITGLRAVLEGPEGSAPASTPATAAPSVKANVGTTATTAQKVIAAKANAAPAEVPGHRSRVEGRKAALAKTDRFAMARTMAEARAERQNPTPAPAPGEGDVTLTPAEQAQRDRDAAGRFVPKPTTALAPAVEGDKPADAAKPTGEKPAELVALEQKHSALEQKYNTELSTLRKGSQEAQERIADIEAERDYHRDLLVSFRNAVRRQFKVDIDPVSLELAEARMQLARGGRADKQRQAQAQAEQVNVRAGEIRSFASQVIAAHPELDPRAGADGRPTNPEAQRFWEMALRDPGKSLEQIAEDARAYATVIRGRQIAAHQQREQVTTEPPVQRRQRPASERVADAGSHGGSANVDSRGRKDVSTKAITAHMGSFRALKGGRA